MRILIVEDDFTGRRLMQKILAPYADCDVAIDGAEAVKAFQMALEANDPYDLICLDIMMPEMDGHQALRAMRRVEEEHGIGGLDGVKVIMTTALDDSRNILGAFREGCEAYVTKPVDPQRLLEQMRKLGLLP